jgi:phage terminase large subunit-like protein
MPVLEADGGKVKPSGYKQEYSLDQAREIARCTKDPIYFIEKYVMLKHPKHGAMPFILYDFQRRLIETYMGNRFNIAMLSRQCGKTQTAAAYLLWWAIFKDNQYILVASKDQGGADEIMERLWYAYEELPWFLKPGVKKNDVKTKSFDNGSKVVTIATTKSSGRGRSVSLLYLDEFAFVPPGVANEFWASIWPTLSSRS